LRRERSQPSGDFDEEVQRLAQSIWVARGIFQLPGCNRADNPEDLRGARLRRWCYALANGTAGRAQDSATAGAESKASRTAGEKERKGEPRMLFEAAPWHVPPELQAERASLSVGLPGPVKGRLPG
jgi:hypothetical protein